MLIIIIIIIIIIKKVCLPLHFTLWNGRGKPIQYVTSFWWWTEGIWVVI